MENLSKEKQNEEMAVENLVAFLWHNTNMYDEDLIFDVAEALVNASYHKQSENTVELPCKIGDKVYRLNYLCTAINEATVKAIYYTEDKKYYPKSHLVVQYDLARGRVRINFSEIGRTLFFTKEEAEKALKGGAE